ncbi:MAG: hypothetical protein ABI597_03530 [Gammaproteobacteria bacterium]
MNLRTNDSSSETVVKSMTAKDYGLESDKCRFTLTKKNGEWIFTMRYEPNRDDKKQLITKLKICSEFSDRVKVILDSCRIDCNRRYQGFHSLYTFIFEDECDEHVEAQLVYLCELLRNCRTVTHRILEKLNLFNSHFGFPALDTTTVTNVSANRMKRVKKRKVNEAYDSQSADDQPETLESKTQEPRVTQDPYPSEESSEGINPYIDFISYYKLTHPEWDQPLIPSLVSGITTGIFDPEGIRKFEKSMTQTLDDSSPFNDSTNIFDQVKQTKHEIDFKREEESFLKKPDDILKDNFDMADTNRPIENLESTKDEPTTTAEQIDEESEDDSNTADNHRPIENLESKKGEPTTAAEKLGFLGRLIARDFYRQPQTISQKELEEEFKAVIALRKYEKSTITRTNATSESNDNTANKLSSSFVYPKAGTLIKKSMFKRPSVRLSKINTITSAAYGYTRISLQRACHFTQLPNIYKMEMVRTHDNYIQSDLRSFVSKIKTLSTQYPEIGKVIDGVVITNHRNTSNSTSIVSIAFNSSLETSLPASRKKDLIVLFQIISNLIKQKEDNNQLIVNAFQNYLSINAAHEPVSNSMQM